MCSSGDSTEQQTEQAQAQLTQSLDADLKTTFGEQQATQAQLKGIYTQMLTNPQGLPGSEIAGARTSAIDNAAAGTAAAQRGAAAVASRGGGDALPSGVTAQVGGDIASAGAASLDSNLTGINIANAQAKQQNMYTALNGLGDVDQIYNPTSFSNSAASNANSVANLGQAYLASQQAGWQDAAGIISGVGGLASAATGFVSANPGGIFGK